MQNLGLQLLVATMMIAVGLELTTTDLTSVAGRVRWLAVALPLNLVLVPAAVWLMATGLDLSDGWTTGLILLAVAPAGPIGPVLARIGGADLAFSTGLMVLLGTVGLVSAPLTASVLLGPQAGSADASPTAGAGNGLFWPMFTALLVFQVVPLVLAMAFRRQWPGFGARVAGPARLISNTILVVVVGSLVVTRASLLIDVPLGVHLALISALGLMLAPTLEQSPSAPLIRGLSTVTAVRNMSVALLLAASFADDPEVEVAILVWAFWMLVTPVVYGLTATRVWRVPPR